MTALDIRASRSARSGLIKRLAIPADRDQPDDDDPYRIPPGFDEAAVDEINALYQQTRRSIEDYANHPPVFRFRLPEVECGTNPGYHHHQRKGEDACGPCKAAHTKAVKSRPSYRAQKAA